MIQVIQTFPLQGVLKLRLALAAANRKVLCRLHEQGGARNHRQLATQSGDHLVGTHFAFGQRLQRNEHAALVG